ncbi:MAG: hypothetical protein J7515_12365 [Caulobacter sp.]|nr:hypothetical protein [Caulobacter sp.]
MLLSAILLFGAPVMAAAATAMDPCCADAPCHDLAKSLCPDACVVACQVIPAPQTLVAEPVEAGPAPVAAAPSRWPPGRAPAPEVPPPR